ncbi:ionotropic receptor 93a-like [Limulus polyphemus]|uniref:Ionotropic receptor 93a-like n=1 Tax=Limulus polyphemus TaxID=6850 RepID=A0ABM1T2N5_LIMPO|nr:ionotropic receptor 93a-like [Limulus polyphemus]
MVLNVNTFISLEADLGLGPFAVNYDRNTAVDVTTPIFIDYNTILVNYKQKRPNFYSYLQAFGWEVWVAMFVSLLTISGVACVADYLILDKVPSKRGVLVFFKYIWRFYGNLFYQSSSYTFHFHHRRVLQAFWWITVIVLMQSFSGHLMATLMMDSGNQIDDLSELDKSNIQPAVEIGSSLHSMFMYDKDPLHKRIYQKMVEQESQSFLPLSKLVSDKVLDLVKQEQFAVVCDTLAIKSAIAARYSRGGECGFYIAKQKFHRYILVMTLRKGLPKSLSSKVNRWIASLVESHLLSATVNNYIGNYTKCLGRKAEETNALSLDDLQGVFILLLGGFCLAIISFTCEKLCIKG